MVTLGSLFSGYGGLDQAVEAFFGARTAWVSDIDPGACKILAHRYPDIPNLGDITAIDWAAVEPVDILTGGFPCQDLSLAGKRAGLRPGTRSGLWEHMAYAIDQLRPRYVVAENVRGLLSARAHSDLEPCPWCVGGSADGEPTLRALGAVLGDLAGLGYDARWVGLRAADVGAPHGRFRVFILAADTAADARREHGRRRPDEIARSDSRQDTPDRPELLAAATADADRANSERHTDLGSLSRASRREVSKSGGADQSAQDAYGPASRERREPTPGQTEVGRARADAGGRNRAPVADAASIGRGEGRPEPTRIFGGSDAALSGCWYCGEPANPGTDCDNCGAHSPATDAERFDQSGRGVLRDVGGAASGSAGEARERQRDRDAADDRGATDWGPYAPAITRWERVLGRPAPAPTETSARGSQRLSPAFVEWLMGLPAGWVTDVPDLSRNAQLKALGNGCVPQQVYFALQLMMRGGPDGTEDLQTVRRPVQAAAQ